MNAIFITRKEMEYVQLCQEFLLDFFALKMYNLIELNTQNGYKIFVKLNRRVSELSSLIYCNSILNRCPRLSRQSTMTPKRRHYSLEVNTHKVKGTRSKSFKCLRTKLCLYDKGDLILLLFFFCLTLIQFEGSKI